MIAAAQVAWSDLPQIDRDDLERLRVMFVTERTARTIAHPPTTPGTCRYCGKRWDAWRGTHYDGHAKCQVSKVFVVEVRAFFSRNRTAGYADVATALGVPVSQIQVWCQRRRNG